MRSVGTWGLASPLLLVVLVGCTSTQTHRTSIPTSEIAKPVGTGTIEGYATPIAPPGGPPPGRVVIVRVLDTTNKVIARQAVQTPFRFRFVVPPGDYTVAENEDPSTPVKVTVYSGQTAEIAYMPVSYN